MIFAKKRNSVLDICTSTFRFINTYLPTLLHINLKPQIRAIHSLLGYSSVAKATKMLLLQMWCNVIGFDLAIAFKLDLRAAFQNFCYAKFQRNIGKNPVAGFHSINSSNSFLCKIQGSCKKANPEGKSRILLIKTQSKYISSVLFYRKALVWNLFWQWQLYFYFVLYLNAGLASVKWSTNP